MLLLQLVAYLSQIDRYDVCPSDIKQKRLPPDTLFKNETFFAFLLIWAVQSFFCVVIKDGKIT